MRHRRFTHRFRRAWGRPALLGSAFLITRVLNAQASPQTPLPAYPVPNIALAQPQEGGTITQDRPTILLRFSQGDSADGLDLGSFAVSIDGVDRTPAFQLSTNDAWGPMSSAADGAPSIGEHRVNARICTLRGACATTHATVVVLPPFATRSPESKPATTAKQSRLKQLLGATVDATRRLFLP